MRKLRSDALWHTFTPAQQKQIQQWLFDDHFSYAKTHALMKSELGLRCALSTIGPIYHRLAELRADNAFLTARDASGNIIAAGVDVQQLRAASDVLIATRVFDELQSCSGVKEIVALGRLAVQNKSRDDQRARTDLARRRLEAILNETKTSEKTGLDRP